MPPTALYYITDRKAVAGGHDLQRARLLARIGEAARCGVDYIQLRETDLAAGELEELARAAAAAVGEARSANPRVQTRLLVNARLDVALAAGADGVHLRARDISVSQVRGISAPGNARLLIAVSCHTEEEVIRASAEGADFVVFGPVFEKKDAPELPAAGLAGLRKACRHAVPVFALGGVTAENAATCLQAGASGIAAIRLFQSGDLAGVVRKLKARE